MRQNEKSSRLPGTASRTTALIIGAILLSSCQAKAEDRLLASELIYFKQEGGWTKSIQIDPWLAPRPDLVRHLRSERIKTMEDGAEECPVDWGCEESSEFRLYHRGERLVSIVEHQSRDGGGAHPITGFADYLYDLERGERIRFGDLFVSWDTARPVLQRAFCAQLRSEYPHAEECPAIEEQAISIMSSSSPGKAGSFMIDTQDYALGYYAAGRAEVHIDLNPRVHSMLRREYQGEFEVTDSAE